jgi:hypothetical protein
MHFVTPAPALLHLRAHCLANTPVVCVWGAPGLRSFLFLDDDTARHVVVCAACGVCCAPVCRLLAAAQQQQSVRANSCQGQLVGGAELSEGGGVPLRCVCAHGPPRVGGWVAPCTALAAWWRVVCGCFCGMWWCLRPTARATKLQLLPRQTQVKQVLPDCLLTNERINRGNQQCCIISQPSPLRGGPLHRHSPCDGRSLTQMCTLCL